MVLFLSGCQSAATPSSMTPIALPAPTGAYGVGVTSLPLVDQSRTETIGENAGFRHRELMVQLWYPITPATAGEPSEYLDELSARFAAVSSAELIPKEAPRLSPDFQFLIKTHAVRDALPAQDGPGFPVLVFSPGYGATYLFYQSLFEDLASHGYFIAAINHPYLSGITVFPDQHFYPQAQPKNEDQFLDDQFRTVVTDIQFVVAQMAVLNQDRTRPFLDRLDLSRIGCFGHSYGGAAAVQACIDDPEIKAAIDIDGSMHGKDYDRPIAKPLGIINNDLTATCDYTVKKLWRNTHRGYMVRIHKARHLDFSDLGVIIKRYYPKRPLLVRALYFGKIEPELAVQLTRKAVLNFFEIYLTGGSDADLLEMPRQYPGQIKITKKP
ncbi:alpha/beta hydrolase family protein [Hydrogenispora ethanolica]|nr:alpha/beta fold hydrolase [Hydrogenispora ethanolica]